MRETLSYQYLNVTRTSLIVAFVAVMVWWRRPAALLSSVVFLLSTCRFALTQSFTEYKFKPILSSQTGSSFLCAADTPDVTIASVKSSLRCSERCSSAAAAKAANKQSFGCNYFNYKRQSSLNTVVSGSSYSSNVAVGSSCELYGSLPTCYAIDSRCVLYQVGLLQPWRADRFNVTLVIGFLLAV